MRKIVSILGIIVFLGVGLLFLKPKSFEKAPEPKSSSGIEKIENIGTINPLLSFAMQATEPKLLDSLNKTSFDLLSKVRLAVVKIVKSSGNDYSLGIALAPNGIIATPARNLNKSSTIDIILETGALAKARWVGGDSQTGLNFLKLDGTPSLSMVDLNESIQMGDVLLVVGKDASLNITVIVRSNLNGRMPDKSLVFYTPKFIDDAFVFNVQGQLVGIGAPIREKSGTMLAIPAPLINIALKQF